MLLLPYRIESLSIERPWVNWAYMTWCVVLSVAALEGWLPGSALNLMVLDGWNPVGLIGHMFLHAGYLHLIGNMIFLWVFGNAMCGMVGNAVYLFVYPLLGLLAAVVQNLASGLPTVGASGAIYGVIGFVLAICPINRVELFYWIWVRAGTFGARVWVITLFWVAFDIYGALRGEGLVAYWAHIGGFVSGLLLGTVMLAGKWIALTEWDNPTLVDIVFRGKRPPPAW